MAEYIEREDVLRCVEEDGHDNELDLGCPDHNEAFQEIIKDIPAADVRSVVRAAWQSWEQDKPPFKWYSCDYCGFHALSRSNYCPNCGADMREV